MLAASKLEPSSKLHRLRSVQLGTGVAVGHCRPGERSIDIRWRESGVQGMAVTHRQEAGVMGAYVTRSRARDPPRLAELTLARCPHPPSPRVVNCGESPTDRTVRQAYTLLLRGLLIPSQFLDSRALASPIRSYFDNEHDAKDIPSTLSNHSRHFSI